MERTIIPLKENGALFGVPGSRLITQATMFSVQPGIKAEQVWDFYHTVDWGSIEQIYEPADLAGSTGFVTVDKNTGYALTYYVDSIGWDGDILTRDETGDGTEENPWRNLNFALDYLWQKCRCFALNMCGWYVQIRIKGTLHRVSRFYSDRVK